MPSELDLQPSRQEKKEQIIINKFKVTFDARELTDEEKSVELWKSLHFQVEHEHGCQTKRINFSVFSTINVICFKGSQF